MASRLPTSRAYWNLRAEQVMDRVFADPALRRDANHLVPVDVAVHEPQPLPPADNPPRGADSWQIPLLTAVTAASVVCMAWLTGNWQTTSARLEQERQLLLIERLRPQPPISTAEPKPEPPAETTPAPKLSPAPTVALEPLTLPLRTPQPQPPVTAPVIQDELPQLTGVVQGPGNSSSAIFQLGSNSLSSGIGTAIGSSGWVLESVSESGAVISRDGQRRSLAVGGIH